MEGKREEKGATHEKINIKGKREHKKQKEEGEKERDLECVQIGEGVAEDKKPFGPDLGGQRQRKDNKKRPLVAKQKAGGEKN